MANARWGRAARIYYHASSYSAAGLVEIPRTRDITVTDEAEDMAGPARDYEYTPHQQGGKDFSVEFDMVIEATDQTALSALRSSYDSQTDLHFVVCRAAKDVAAGSALTFVGQVMKWSESYPQGSDTATVSVMLRNTDTDNPPARASTPLA